MYPLRKSFIIAALLPTLARAHHGRDFILLQDYSQPAQGSGNLTSGFEWSRSGGADEYSVEPGLLYALMPRVAVGLTGTFMDEGTGFGYASFMPYIHWQITPRSSTFPIRIALVTGYQFAENRDPSPVKVKVITPGKRLPVTKSATRTITLPDDGGGNEDPGPCGPEYGPDAPPCPTTPVRVSRHTRHAGHDPGGPPQPTTIIVSSSSTSNTSGPPTTSFLYVTPETPHGEGIHRHAEAFFSAKLILEADVTPEDKLLVNLINITPESGKPAWGYGVGYRHSFTHSIGVGLEAIGDCGDANEHEIVLATYLSPTHHLTFNLGIGHGLTKQSSDFSIRTGLVWRF